MRFGIRIGLDGSFGEFGSESMRADVYSMYQKHKEAFEFRFPDESNDERRYYVYEWHTSDKGKIFYVGKGTGDRYKHILWDMNRSRGGQYKELQDHFGIEHRIIVSDLTSFEAEIYEVCLIHEYTERGEVLLQFVDMPYDTAKFEEEKKTFKERSFLPEIRASDYRKRYFDIDISPAFDLVNRTNLMQTHFLSAGSSIEPYTSDERHEIRDFIENSGGHIYTSLAKSARSVIEFGILDYDKYLLLKRNGYDVYHSFDVIKFIQANPHSSNPGPKKGIKVPKYDEVGRAKYSEYLACIRFEIPLLAGQFHDDGYEAECLGFEYEGNQDYFNAIMYYEASAFMGFCAPAVYMRLAILYRRWGMFEDELRVLDRALQRVAIDNTSRITLSERRDKVVEVLTEISRQ